MAPLPEDRSVQALRGLAWYGQRKPTFTGGNEVTLLRGATEQFPALCASIDQATSSVWMATYLVSNIGHSQSVLQALMRAAQRGIDVNFVVDGLGSRDAPASLWRGLQASGVKLVMYRPVHGLWSLLDASQYRRMHMKLCVVDDEVGYVGGINLIDDHFDLAQGWSNHPRLDYALQVKGACVMPVAHTIKAMWTRASVGRDWRDDIVQWMADNHGVHRLRTLWRKARFRPTAEEQQQLSATANTAMRCAFVLRDNLLQRRTIERAALQAIQHARTRVDIVTPYFYPARALRHALRNAAKRGVTVRLLLQGKVDYKIAAIAARVLYHELQQYGVRIFEYQPALLHAKVLCVDDEWATVGSSNLDPLSLVLNLEANLIVRDRGFVRTLSAALAIDFADSTEIPPPLAQQRSWVSRARRSTVAWMAKTYLRLAGVTGRY